MLNYLKPSALSIVLVGLLSLPAFVLAESPCETAARDSVGICTQQCQRGIRGYFDRGGLNDGCIWNKDLRTPYAKIHKALNESSVAMMIPNRGNKAAAQKNGNSNQWIEWAYTNLVGLCSSSIDKCKADCSNDPQGLRACDEAVAGHDVLQVKAEQARAANVSAMETYSKLDTQTAASQPGAAQSAPAAPAVSQPQTQAPNRSPASSVPAPPNANTGARAPAAVRPSAPVQTVPKPLVNQPVRQGAKLLPPRTTCPEGTEWQAHLDNIGGCAPIFGD
jgi:hypothetical protein